MDYNILETFTLKSISVDIDREIKRLNKRLNQLQEQKETIDVILIYREDNKHNIHQDDSIIHPLK